MPHNCPIGLYAPEDCESCRQYDSAQEACRFFVPSRPIMDILTIEERVLRLERLYSVLKVKLEKANATQRA